MSSNAGQPHASACYTAAVRLVDIHKTYGTIPALAGLDVTLAAGEIHALLGSNGAGKTTAIGIMTGLRRADSGSVEVLGGNPQDVGVRRRIGLTPQESGFPNNLRVSEIVRLVCAHYATPLSDADLFARFPLQAVWRRQAGGLSGGQNASLPSRWPSSAIPTSCSWTNRPPVWTSRRDRLCGKPFSATGTAAEPLFLPPIT